MGSLNIAQQNLLVSTINLLDSKKGCKSIQTMTIKQLFGMYENLMDAAAIVTSKPLRVSSKKRWQFVKTLHISRDDLMFYIDLYLLCLGNIRDAIYDQIKYGTGTDPAAVHDWHIFENGLFLRLYMLKTSNKTFYKKYLKYMAEPNRKWIFYYKMPEGPCFDNVPKLDTSHCGRASKYICACYIRRQLSADYNLFKKGEKSDRGHNIAIYKYKQLCEQCHAS